MCIYIYNYLQSVVIAINGCKWDDTDIELYIIFYPQEVHTILFPTVKGHDCSVFWKQQRSV